MEDVEGIQANMASVMLQETEENASQQGEGELLIRVGGTMFLLERATIDLFQSEFLDKLLDPETHFRKPEDSVYNVQADEECFSVFLHMIRYGSLPACMILDKEKESALLQEACFWGIEGKVQDKIRETKAKVEIPRHRLDQLTSIAINFLKTMAPEGYSVWNVVTETVVGMVASTLIAGVAKRLYITNWISGGATNAPFALSVRGANVARIAIRQPVFLDTILDTSPLGMLLLPASCRALKLTTKTCPSYGL
jgi:hypothetical protein